MNPARQENPQRWSRTKQRALISGGGLLRLSGLDSRFYGSIQFTCLHDVNDCCDHVGNGSDLRDRYSLLAASETAWELLAMLSNTLRCSFGISVFA